MLEPFVQWLDRTGPFTFWACVALLVALDSAAIGAVVLSRSRTLVNRVTRPVLVLNALLIAAAIGVPTATFTARTALRAAAPFVTVTLAKDAGPNAPR